MSSCPVPDSDWLSTRWSDIYNNKETVTVEDLQRLRVWLVNARLMNYGSRTYDENDGTTVHDNWTQVLRRNEKRLGVCDDG